MSDNPEEGQAIYVLCQGVWRYGKAEYIDGKLRVYDAQTSHIWADTDDWIDAECVNARLGKS